ncbi:MAG: metalloregulator ArsR/SmtB family transcription factor [Pseudomonadales bacterium]|nr:metalloregulator ArsR/SmtB family transcription factor [Pseudomonadales bacterium]
MTNNNNRILKHPAPPVLHDVESLTSLCKATADSLRLLILRILRTDSLGVLEMCRIFAIRQSALSHHLKILSQGGLVSTRRESNAIFYRRALMDTEDPLAKLKATVFETVDRIRLDPTLSERLFQIKQERDQQSLDFFTKFADKFKQNQELVADSQHYASALRDLLHGMHLPTQSRVLEVGPGEGLLLPMLAGTYADVIALDTSEEMLNRARATVQGKNIRNVRFVLGDTRTAIEKKLRVRLMVFSMVLHHISSPAEILMDSATLLEDEGAVLIVDLCRHNQDWVKASCGDLWLGFEPEELTNWALQAGFDSGQSLYLGLRNGFQIQMRLFNKRPSENL